MIKGERFLPKPYLRRNFYVPEEVSKHNVITSAWVTLHGQVFDITRLLHEHHSSPVG